MKNRISILGLVAVAWAVQAEIPGDRRMVQLDGGVIETSAAERQAEFRTLKASGPSMARRVSTARGARPWLVQFDNVIQEEGKANLRKAGADIKGYIPENAFVIEAPENRIAAINAIPGVAWVGEYLPAYKEARPVRQLRSRTPHATANLNVILFDPSYVDLVRKNIERIPGAVIVRAAAKADRGLVRARLPLSSLDQVAQWPEVEWLEPYIEPVWLNDVAAGTNRMNVTPAWSGLGLSGTGQVIAVCDTGLDTGNPVSLHADIRGRVRWAQALGRTNRWDDIHGHGTHVCGSAVGNGAMSGGQYRGIAHGAELVIQSVLDAAGGMQGLPDDLNELFLAAYTNDARIHSNSWGAPTDGLYDTGARDVDMFVWNNRQMLILFAAGNEGDDFEYINYQATSDGVIDLDSLSSPGTAKNCLTVGAAESFRTQGGLATNHWGSGSWSNYYPVNPTFSDLISQPDSPQGLAAFSSRGPCDDGRIKPDLVAPGTDIVSTRSTKTPSSQKGWGITDNTNYLYMGGTSMATPLVAGAAGLVRQWLQEARGMAQPSAALIKALLLNGARNMAPGQYGDGAAQEIPFARPNPVQGWGHIDLFGALSPPADQVLFLDDARSLSTGKTNTFTVPVLASTTGRMVVTMAYSDYWGTYGSGRQLVNDLDLSVESPSGIIFFPNNLAGPDNLNNVETIELIPAEIGVYSVRVRARNVPSGGSQPYALVMLYPLTHEEDDLRISPIGLFEVDGPQGGPFAPTSRVFTLINDGVTALEWNAKLPSELDWIDMAPVSGLLPAGATQLVTCTIHADADAKAGGTYTGMIAFSNHVSGRTLERAASLLVRSLGGFQWSHIPSPRQQGVPFDAAVTAVDELGNTLTAYDGQAALFLSGVLTNQVGVAGSTTWNFPVDTYPNNQRAQVIYQAGELGSEAVSIQGLALHVTHLPSLPLENWTIRMKHTDWSVHPTNLWEGPASGWSTVYQSDFTLPGTGWVWFAFSEPFAYDGVRNLMVDFSFNNTGSDARLRGRVSGFSGEGGRTLFWETWLPGNSPLTWSGATFRPYMTNIVPVVRFVAERSLFTTPSSTGAFKDGVWAGEITVGLPAESIRLKAVQGSAVGSSNPFDIDAANARVYVSGLSTDYDGSPKSIVVTTDPSGLQVVFTYDGATNLPVHAGSYVVTGRIEDVVYRGYAVDVFTIRRGDQMLTFPFIPDQEITNTVPLAASSSSGLEVTYLLTGPAARNGNLLIFSATGAVTVTALQPGDGDWLSAVPVTNAFSVGPVVDSNGNGIPDAWEWGHFGSLTSVHPASDHDIDGMTDYEEYIADTNPTNALSFQSLEIRSSPFSNAWIIVFDTATGRLYRLEASFSLEAGAWHTAIDGQPGSGQAFQWLDTNGAPVRLYRHAVRLSP